MTEPPSTTPPHDPSSDDADLLASLYLDGEATAEERSRVEADPALLERVDEFRHLANAVGAPAVPPPGLAATQIAAALEQFGAGTTATTAEPDQVQDHRVVSLTEHRARRSAPPAWIGAAAVAALVVGGLGFVATQGGDDDEAASVETSLSASAADAAADPETTTTPFQREELATEAAESELMEDAPTDDAGADVAADDEGDDSDAGDSDSADDEGAAPAPLTPEEAADYYAANGPIDLTELEAATAGEYYEQIVDAPVQAIEESPCADSPVVAELTDVDGFIPVIYRGRTASLFVAVDDPSTATIVGPTCDVELD